MVFFTNLKKDETQNFNVSIIIHTGKFWDGTFNTASKKVWFADCSEKLHLP